MKAKLVARKKQEDEQESSMRSMRKVLLATVAATSVLGSIAVASAQGPVGDQGRTATPPATGATQDQNQKRMAPGATMKQPGNEQPGPAAQGPGRGEKSDQRMGQAPRDESTPQRGAQTEQPGTGARTHGSRGASVLLSQDQRSRIQTIIGKGSGARVTTNVKFDVSVGAVVPRGVHVEVLPEDVVAVVPQYEGFDYVVVGDQILIVDPESLEIVATIPT